MNDKEQLVQIAIEHPEVCEPLLAQLRLLRGQQLPAPEIYPTLSPGDQLLLSQRLCELELKEVRA